MIEQADFYYNGLKCAKIAYFCEKCRTKSNHCKKNQQVITEAWQLVLRNFAQIEPTVKAFNISLSLLFYNYSAIQ